MVYAYFFPVINVEPGVCREPRTRRTIFFASCLRRRNNGRRRRRVRCPNCFSPSNLMETPVIPRAFRRRWRRRQRRLVDEVCGEHTHTHARASIRRVFVTSNSACVVCAYKFAGKRFSRDYRYNT